MSLTILAVDDSRTIREMLGHTLRQAGYQVITAEDGVHGLEVLQTERPDVIVTDINMPRLDGFGFIEAVRAEGASRTTPILVLTTESEPEKKARARAASEQVLPQKRITNATCPMSGETLDAAAVPILFDGQIYGFASLADANDFRALTAKPEKQRKIIEQWKASGGG